ncbi:helix-turn-helix domain-containing protein [Nonomuraea longicatena]|uniref:Helix-turn-helix domain-containing protein n=1 Tax=Nonomuraea longicatena TaxID=83682 RepID=A0ABP4B3Q4_9ACTN
MTELKIQVRELRIQGKSPKEIARALGVKPSVVAPLVREIAAETATTAEPELIGCWISTGWSAGLSFDPAHGWHDEGAGQSVMPGWVSVLVARRHGRDRASIAGFLADVHCLGVKFTHGPEVMDEVQLRSARDFVFSDYPGYQEAPIELARQLVWGSTAYAESLGFEAHTDLPELAGHLGALEGPSVITFGRDGRPFYTPSPQDDADKVVRRLRSRVGDDFGYVVLDAG